MVVLKNESMFLVPKTTDVYSYAKQNSHVKTFINHHEQSLLWENWALGYYPPPAAF